MKSLIQFIKESYEDKQISNLFVYYDINNGKDVFVNAPETYSEDDLTLYLGDRWFKEFPGQTEQTRRIMGNNADKIIDMHFEYSSFKHIDKTNNKVNVDWNNEYDTKNSDNSNLNTFVLSNLKFVIQFETFNIKVEKEENIDNDLLYILKTTESSSLNQYPIDVFLDKEKPFEYSKGSSF